jgi:hypothetical protein
MLLFERENPSQKAFVKNVNLVQRLVLWERFKVNSGRFKVSGKSFLMSIVAQKKSSKGKPS